VNGEERTRLKGVDRVLGPVTWVAAGALVVMLFVGPVLIAEDEPAESAAAEQSYGEDDASAGGESADGEALFSENCGGCHTLEAAGTTGAVGPNLDDAGLDAGAVSAIVAGGSGSMPSFEGDLDPAEIEAIAQFVSDSSG
jgi:mono/diheme cytochrome c family protein